jgi:hypothetical protein
VVEDDAQNGPDHVDAHRSTVFVASPYTKSGAVIHTNYNSSNVVRTIEDILGVNYLGLNDANARPMSDVFIKQPNLQPYVAPIPGTLCQPPVDPRLVPECHNPGNRPVTVAVKPLHDGAPAETPRSSCELLLTSCAYPRGPTPPASTALALAQLVGVSSDECRRSTSPSN